MAKRKGNTGRPGWCTLTVRSQTDDLAAKVAKALAKRDPLPGDVPKWKAVHVALTHYLEHLESEQ